MAADIPTPLSLLLAAEHSFNRTLLGFAILNSLLWAIYKVEIYPHFLSPLRHLPGPQGGYPLIGHGLVQFKKPLGWDFLKWLKEVPNDGIIHYRGFFNSDQLFLTSIKGLAEVLVAKPYDFEKPAKSRLFLSRVLGDGLVVIEGDVHKYQRKHVLPSFSFRHIKGLYPTFWGKSVDLTRRIASEVLNYPASPDTSGVTDINTWSTKVTLDLIGIAGMGRDFNTLENSDDELVKNYELIMNPSFEIGLLFAVSSIGPPWAAKLLPGSVDKRFTTATNTLRQICKTLVREKREAIKVESEESVDLLSKLIKSNDFSDDELVDQLLTFLAAGHETTSSTFAWAAYLLAINPQIQASLRYEIRPNIPTSLSKDPTFDLAATLESLPLLNGICNETLRLYPTVPMTLRLSSRPTTILNHPVPKGTQVFMAPWAINRSPELWGSTADLFNPGRWIDAATGKPNNTGGANSNYAIMTFLHGPRSCIGQGFAKAELRALVAAFVGTFEIEMANKNEVPIPTGVVTTKPRDGMNQRLKVVGEWE